MANRHYLADYLQTCGYTGDLKGVILQNSHIPSAKQALQQDQNAFLLNAIISFSSCITSINHKQYSWAFIKSYYTLFYLAKSLLAEKEYAVYYSNKKAYSIRIFGGETFKFEKGNSHDVILRLFRTVFEYDLLLSNKIGDDNPLDWFENKRNEINYRLNPFTDPQPLEGIFNYNNDIRKWLILYLNDYLEGTHIYTFSENHAYIAYIHSMLLRIFKSYEVNGRKNRLLNDERIIFLRKCIKDNSGPINCILDKIESIKYDNH